MLIDGHNRVIDYLRISVTDRCNLRCLYCMPPEGITPYHHNQILRYEEITRVAALAATLGISKIRLTGGEPLVRKDIHLLIRDLAQLPGIEDLSMTTNGLRLAACSRVLRDAGLQRVNVSMDSLDPQRYAAITRGGDLELVLQGLISALDAGMDPVKINVVALEGVNQDEIIPFARLTMEWPFEVRFIEWMPVGRSLKWEPGAFIPSDRILSRIREAFPLEPAPTPRRRGNGPAEIFQIPGGLGSIGVISPMTRHFCHACNRLRLTADGRLRSCLFSDEEIDIKTFLRTGASDNDIRDQLRRAIREKPRASHVRTVDGRIKKCMRPMNRIGG
jgi:cyclic pyranopterin phosphate synthase